MTDESKLPDEQLLTSAQLRTPRAAAYAGIVFAVLTIVSELLLQTSLPADPPTDPRWLTDAGDRVTVAVTLVPFAAIAFLWFIGVLRDLLGREVVPIASHLGTPGSFGQFDVLVGDDVVADRGHAALAGDPDLRRRIVAADRW